MNYVVGSISGRLLQQLYILYHQGIHQLGSGKVLKYGINGYCDCAITSYPLAVAIWEAFLYETILSHWSLSDNKNSKINCIPPENINNWDILTKSIVIPDLLYDKTFNKGSQPFQDLSHLVFIRNSIVHFKFNHPNKRTLNAVNDLSQRKVFFDFSKDRILKPHEIIPLQDWTTTISTTEGIRWAINTIANMSLELNELIPVEKRNLIMRTIGNFKTISVKEAHNLFVRFGVDPNSGN
jgi:hypothetical protein